MLERLLSAVHQHGDQHSLLKCRRSLRFYKHKACSEMFILRSLRARPGHILVDDSGALPVLSPDGRPRHATQDCAFQADRHTLPLILPLRSLTVKRGVSPAACIPGVLHHVIGAGSSSTQPKKGYSRRRPPRQRAQPLSGGTRRAAEPDVLRKVRCDGSEPAVVFPSEETCPIYSPAIADAVAAKACRLSKRGRPSSLATGKVRRFTTSTCRSCDGCRVRDDLNLNFIMTEVDEDASAPCANAPAPAPRQ